MRLGGAAQRRDTVHGPAESARGEVIAVAGRPVWRRYAAELVLVHEFQGFRCAAPLANHVLPLRGSAR